VPAVVRLFGNIVDELHGQSSDTARRHFKAPYSRRGIERRMHDRDGVYLAAKLKGKVVGFLFGWIWNGTGHIRWMGIARHARGLGLGTRLVERALRRFRERGCYEVKVFTYPGFDATYQFFKKLGFAQKAHIEKEFFGTAVNLMVKKLAHVPAHKTAKKIVLAGEAGQGIKLMAHALATVLAKMGKEVSLNLVYGPEVRGGEVEAELIYADEPIEVPLIERADLRVQLSKPSAERFNARRVLIEQSVCGHRDCLMCDFRCPASERVPFGRLAVKKFGSPLFINMIALGRLLSRIGMGVEQVAFAEALPPRFLEQNIRAIRYGFTFRD
jgi:Pyruvate/2-oxoacid:ferredoxin oxidoreductase gamma subunit/ribosomal protein S18 acetylase RimI-like enzyme